MATSDECDFEEKKTVSLVTYSSDDSYSETDDKSSAKAYSVSAASVSNVDSSSLVKDVGPIQEQFQRTPLDLSFKTLSGTKFDFQDSKSHIPNKTELLKTQPSHPDKESTAQRVHLPLPSEILKLYETKQNKEGEDDKSQHGDKIRSFPHERGVWATYVFIDYEPVPAFQSLIDEILRTAEKQSIKLTRGESYHISLSQTLKLRHHSIRPFIDSLKPHLQTFYRFNITLQSLDVYLNEEKTRTFLGLKIHIGKDNLLRLVEKIDKCLKEFQLPVFFQEPSFHLSIAWSVGNITDDLLRIMPDLQIMFQSFTEEHPECRTVSVEKISCKSGNKLFVLPLKEKS